MCVVTGGIKKQREWKMAEGGQLRLIDKKFSCMGTLQIQRIRRGAAPHNVHDLLQGDICATTQQI